MVCNAGIASNFNCSVEDSSGMVTVAASGIAKESISFSNDCRVDSCRNDNVWQTYVPTSSQNLQLQNYKCTQHCNGTEQSETINSPQPVLFRKPCNNLLRKLCNDLTCIWHYLGGNKCWYLFDMAWHLYQGFGMLEDGVHVIVRSSFKQCTILGSHSVATLVTSPAFKGYHEYEYDNKLEKNIKSGWYVISNK